MIKRSEVFSDSDELADLLWDLSTDYEDDKEESYKVYYLREASLNLTEMLKEIKRLEAIVRDKK